MTIIITTIIITIITTIITTTTSTSMMTTSTSTAWGWPTWVGVSRTVLRNNFALHYLLLYQDIYNHKLRKKTTKMNFSKFTHFYRDYFSKASSIIAMKMNSNKVKVFCDLI